jgi:hypothetical protein
MADEKKQDEVKQTNKENDKKNDKADKGSEKTGQKEVKDKDKEKGKEKEKDKKKEKKEKKDTEPVPKLPRLVPKPSAAAGSEQQLNDMNANGNMNYQSPLNNMDYNMYQGYPGWGFMGPCPPWGAYAPGVCGPAGMAGFDMAQTDMGQPEEEEELEFQWDMETENEEPHMEVEVEDESVEVEQGGMQMMTC